MLWILCTRRFHSFCTQLCFVLFFALLGKKFRAVLHTKRSTQIKLSAQYWSAYDCPWQSKQITCKRKRRFIVLNVFLFKQLMSFPYLFTIKVTKCTKAEAQNIIAKWRGRGLTNLVFPVCFSFPTVTVVVEVGERVPTANSFRRQGCNTLLVTMAKNTCSICEKQFTGDMN